MSFDGRAVANFILDFCESKSRGITHISLQKILFFCHVWSLIILRRPLLRKQFEAWQHGPVLQHLYLDFKKFKDRPIDGRASGIDPISGERRVIAYAFDNETLALLTEVVDFYSRLSASDLRNLSHAIGGPWDEVRNHQGQVNPGMKIDNDSIAKFYSKVTAPFTKQ